MNHVQELRLEYAVDYNVIELVHDDEVTTAARKALRISFDNCWTKLNQYYQVFHKLPAYAAAVVLHPGLKWLFFKKQWKHQPDWTVGTKKNVRDFWESKYKELANSTVVDESFHQTMFSNQHRKADPLAKFVPSLDFYLDQQVVAA